jgi:hypothetical protein
MRDHEIDSELVGAPLQMLTQPEIACLKEPPNLSSSLDIGGITRSRGIAATDAQFHRPPVNIERNARHFQ